MVANLSQAGPCTTTLLDLTGVEHLLQRAPCMGAPACTHPAGSHGEAASGPCAEVAWIEKSYC